jgi:hypothetical protein
MKTFVARILLVVYLIFVVTIILFNPKPVFAPAGWGDAFTNDKGQIICICAPEKDCYPCAILK